MAQFTVNAARVDPYKNFKFRIKWDGRYVAGVSKISALGAAPKLSNTAKVATPVLRADRQGAQNTRRSRWNAA